MRAHGHGQIDTKQEIADSWKEQVNMVFNATVLPQSARDTRSWYIGANVEGKNVEPMFYFGGVGPYFEHCKKEIDEGFPGFTFSGSGAVAAS